MPVSIVHLAASQAVYKHDVVNGRKVTRLIGVNSLGPTVLCGANLIEGAKQTVLPHDHPLACKPCLRALLGLEERPSFVQPMMW